VDGFRAQGQHRELRQAMKQTIYTVLTNTQHHDIFALKQPSGITGVFMAAKLIATSAPDFTLSDVQGRAVRLADYRGKANVVLVFNRGVL
jgi:hypothetical protein